MNNNKDISPEILTLVAVIIGFILIDELDSAEQNAIGNWFMLIGQVLCTNGSEYFKSDWHNHLDRRPASYERRRYKKGNTLDLLSRVKDSISKGIDSYKE